MPRWQWIGGLAAGRKLIILAKENLVARHSGKLGNRLPIHASPLFATVSLPKMLSFGRLQLERVHLLTPQKSFQYGFCR